MCSLTVNTFSIFEKIFSNIGGLMCAFRAHISKILIYKMIYIYPPRWTVCERIVEGDHLAVKWKLIIIGREVYILWHS